PEGQGAGAGQGVEERLLLHRIELERPHVAERDLQDAVLVEADAADAVEAGRDDAPVAAREAADAAARELFVQLAFGGAAGEDFGEGAGAGLHRRRARRAPDIVSIIGPRRGLDRPTTQRRR